MAAVERTYIIPLRKEWLKSPRYRRAKKAVTAVKGFLIKHMKSDDIRLGKHLNEELWKHGIKNPPGKIKVNVLKDDKNVVRAELFGKKMDMGEKKAEEKQGIASKMAEKITGKKAVKKKPKKAEKEEKIKEEAPAAKEEKKEEVKKEPAAKEEKPKAEVKEEVKKEAPKPEAKPAEKSA